MDKKEILEKLMNMDTLFDTNNRDPNISLMEIGFDSVDYMQFLLEIEENFNVKIEEGELNEIVTINYLVDYIINNQNG